MDNTKLHTVDAVGDHTIGAVRILTDQGIQIAGCYVPGTERNNEADAAELVRRWNAHAALVEALESIETALHNGPTAREDGDVVQAVRDRKGDYLSMLTDLGDVARTAIAKATGG